MRKKKTGFIFKLFVALTLIAAIFTGGYFFLDKKIVPKYFGQYGINSIPDLVGVVTSLYNSPKTLNTVGVNAITQRVHHIVVYHQANEILLIWFI